MVQENIKNKNMRNKYALRGNEISMKDCGKNRQYDLGKMRDLAIEERPRERLLREGPSVLSPEELLTIIFNVGTKKEDALAMATRVFRAYGEKSIAFQKNPKVIRDEMKISEIKACQIVACFELGRRFFQENSGRQIIIKTSKQVYNYLKDMHNLPKEQLRGLYLNSRYRLIHDEVISIGSLTANIVHPREVFRPALEYSAVAVILAHNHPSGIAKATEEDIRITKQLVKAGEILGIDILDHIIVANSKFESVPVDYK
jgi:DNA repair protein RadC